MTTIVGKDAPLEQSIAHFQEILKKLKIVVRESNWLNPLNDVYSVHLDIESCPCIYSMVKVHQGLQLELQLMASSLNAYQPICHFQTII